ncbi:hypothetical protein HS048_12925 [Planomonospora sp. ID91781]|uniref:Serine/arginine repetitive matrix protein 2 n=1 Tax=Planomonospora sphaerica TaxID=161355 RepID=A0A171CJ03_9ACTN|nr:MULTISPECIES: hypothetical protein [Planomonospora]MBG0821639.1 hypothetical protein [Planomonospora sp. ID91781]GAT66779.1 hypothetical protein PS9374_02431 [Planomonospora sphaerica]
MSHDFGNPSGGFASPSGTPQHPAQQPAQHPSAQPYGGAPSYGYAPPGYGAPQGPPPKVKAGPSIGWIVGAWLLAVVSVIAGIAVFAGGVLSFAEDAAPPASYGPGEVFTVRLDPAESPALYVSAAQGTKFQCGFQEGTQGRLENSLVQTTVTGSDGIPWELAFRIGVDQAGEYKLGCSVEEGGQARFGVGRELAAGALVGGTVALFLIPGFGVLLAIVVTIVVLVKRSRARKLNAAVPVGGWGPGGPYRG